jgi:hypothetical protein
MRHILTLLNQKRLTASGMWSEHNRAPAWLQLVSRFFHGTVSVNRLRTYYCNTVFFLLRKLQQLLSSRNLNRLSASCLYASRQAASRLLNSRAAASWLCASRQAVFWLLEQQSSCILDVGKQTSCLLPVSTVEQLLPGLCANRQAASLLLVW